ncbi:tripartite motif-containing protein 16-like isoform 1-T2 [Pholidichthys leucotaenia]
MAEGEVSHKKVKLDIEAFSCSICLDLYKDPVTIPCGHSFCMNCIKTKWDEEDEDAVCSCPQCRKTFEQRPVLVKSMTLAGLVENLKPGLEAAPPGDCYAGPEDVACDVCTGRKLKAVKSCLDCRASYCEKDLQPHHNAAPLKKHKLVDPNKNLQENICPRHDELMKVFCCTDQQIICYLCTLDEHKGHKTVPATAEMTEKQKELEVTRQKIQERIQDREKDVKVLQQEVEAINGSADKTVEDNKKIFSDLICLLQKRSSEVEEQIRSQQETEVNRVEELQEQLEQEIADLKKKDSELEQLSQTEDRDQFLLAYNSLSKLGEPTPSSSIKIRPLKYFEEVTAAVSEISDKLQDLLTEKWPNISMAVSEVDVLLSPPEPKTRAGFLKYSHNLTMDPNTAHINLLITDGYRKASKRRQPQYYANPYSPERFTSCWGVLSRDSLTGRRYFEVEWKGWGVNIAVAYKNMRRAGNADESRFGFNDKSWSLRCGTDNYKFLCNNVQTPITGPGSSRIGVYLDHDAGILSYYSVTETMTLLHRVQTTFTQPLYAGLGLYGNGTTVEFVKLK